MAKNSNASFAYEALVSIILPEGILDVFPDFVTQKTYIL